MLSWSRVRLLRSGVWCTVQAARSVLDFSQTLQRTLSPALSDHSGIQHCLLQRCAPSPSFSDHGIVSEHPGEVERVSAGAGAANLVSGYRTLAASVARYPTSGRRLNARAAAYSDLAVARHGAEAVVQGSEIGYEVLGQYVPEGDRIDPQSAFAVVRVGSHQFKVTPGDMIYTEKLKYADINDKLVLNKVLLMGSMKQTIIGRPTIPDARVLAAVEEIALDAKIIVFKKKRRKNYRRTNGHRQELTRLRILQIEGFDTPSLPEYDSVNEAEDTV